MRGTEFNFDPLLVTSLFNKTNTMADIYQFIRTCSKY